MKIKTEKHKLCSELRETRSENLDHRSNDYDVIRLNFLKRSARYLGAYENRLKKT